MKRVTKNEKQQAINPNYALTGIWLANDIKRRHNGHFFSPDTMRFFASRLIQAVFPTNTGTVYFVTSEKACFDDPSRVYNVRRYTIDNDSFDTLDTLTSRARALTRALDSAYQDTIKEPVTL